MHVWIISGCAILIIAVLAYNLRAHLILVGHEIQRQEIEQAVHQMYDTPENIIFCMKTFPDDPAPVILWIRLAERENDWAEVVVRARLMVKRFPQLFQGQYMLARACGVTGNIVESRRLTRQLYRKWPKDSHRIELDISQCRSEIIFSCDRAT